MRYDETVYFVRKGEKTYDLATGNYVTAEPVKTAVLAAVMGLTADTMQLLYGGIRQGAVNIHIQNHYTGPFDWIEYRDKRYRVDFTRTLRIKQTFTVSEVQS